VLPQLLQALDRLSGVDDPSQIEAVRAELKALSTPRPPRIKSVTEMLAEISRSGLTIPTASWSPPGGTPTTPSWPTPDVTPTLPTWPSQPTARVRSWPSISPARAIALTLSLVPFFATLAIPWDLPANAGWATILLSRVLILLMDAALLGPFIAVLWPGDDEPKDAFGMTQSGMLSRSVIHATVRMLPIVAIFVLAEAHKEWVGPLTLWHQAVLFAVNLAGLA